MSKAQTDIRATSYNAATANPNGYTGTIDDAIAQIRAEPDEVRAYLPLNASRERHELLGFLGVHKRNFSGVQGSAGWTVDGDYRYPAAPTVENWSVEYGAPEAPVEPGKWSLAYAKKRWPECFANETEACTEQDAAAPLGAQS
jgi:hypothetical protein